MGIKDWLDDEQYSALQDQYELNDCLTGLDYYDSLDPDEIEWECYEDL